MTDIFKSSKVAYLGPIGTWSNFAAEKYFGKTENLFPFSDFRQIFQYTETGKVDYAIVPIENSIEGDVSPIFDELTLSPLKICGELILSVNHCLASKRSLKKIRVVYSHPQALAQCRQWLNTYLPEATRRETSSTSKASKKAKSSFLGKKAAITTEISAQQNQLKIHHRNIQDIPKNYTRFVILSLKSRESEEHTHISLMISIPHQAGSLASCLEIFKKYKISLTKITSRPSRKEKWNYIFFIDLKGKLKEEKIVKALEEIKEKSNSLKILGSF